MRVAAAAMAPWRPWPTGGGLGFDGTTTEAPPPVLAPTLGAVEVGAAAATRAAAASDGRLGLGGPTSLLGGDEGAQLTLDLGVHGLLVGDGLVGGGLQRRDLGGLLVDLVLGGVEAGLVVLGLLLGGGQRVDRVAHVAGAGLEVGALLQPGVGVAGEEGVELGAVVAVLVGLDGDGAHRRRASCRGRRWSGRAGAGPR